MNPDQSALSWELSDLGPYYLQFRLPRNISRQKELAKGLNVTCVRHIL